jgi:hypothetical protein
MHISFTEIWFDQSHSETQRMKFLLWVRRKCADAGYSNVRLLGRSPIAKPADASDFVISVECENESEYFRLLPVIAGLCEGMPKRFTEAGGRKWGESMFFDVVAPLRVTQPDSFREQRAIPQEVSV